MANVLEGKTLSKEILDSLPPKIEKIKKKSNRPPKLAIINYYENSPSGVYVKRKIKACDKLGIKVELIRPDEKSGYEYFKDLLSRIGRDSSIDALMIERPLPKEYEKTETLDAVPSDKDVDGISSRNIGRLFSLKKMEEITKAGFFVPCTALAVIRLLKKYSIDLKGKRAAMLGRSPVVGKPLSHMLSASDATVTLCHSKTKNISSILKQSEIVISAVGKALWIKEEMLSRDSIIIDVGTNVGENGKMRGDVDFEKVKDKVSAITPVPGGVGPVTLACLLEGVVKAAENNIRAKQ